MTQVRDARQGVTSEAIDRVAVREGVAATDLRDLVGRGMVVVPANPLHEHLEPVGIGSGLRVKVNANIGTAPGGGGTEDELRKLHVARDAGADTVMDLSIDGDLQTLRAELLRQCPLPFGTVPLYEAASSAACTNGAPERLSEDLLLEVVERQAKQGVDFMTVHCGLTQRALGLLRADTRRMGIVSRGGSLLAAWMIAHGKENPFYSRFDDLLAIARAHEVTLSLGDGLRPGCLADAGDAAQIEELVTLGELVRRARAAEVQVMVEGPGHVPLDQVRAHVTMQKTVCQQAPFYVLGPLVTDIAPGYDHIAGAIGGALAAWAGADFLCYITPAEHLGLPADEDVRAGVIAARIAAHAADVARGRAEARGRDDQMAAARWALDWERQSELALDPAVVRRWRAAWSETCGDMVDHAACSMCGAFCAVKTARKAFGMNADRPVQANTN